MSVNFRVPLRHLDLQSRNNLKKFTDRLPNKSKYRKIHSSGDEAPNLRMNKCMSSKIIKFTSESSNSLKRMKKKKVLPANHLVAKYFFEDKHRFKHEEEVFCHLAYEVLCLPQIKLGLFQKCEARDSNGSILGIWLIIFRRNLLSPNSIKNEDGENTPLKRKNLERKRKERILKLLNLGK
jgi:hypothetical protein